MLQHLLHQPLWGEVIGWSAALSHFPISYIWVRCFTLSACLLGGVCAWLEPWHMKMTSGQWQQSIFFFALVLELITCHNKSLWTRTCISEESNTICGITSIITRRYRQEEANIKGSKSTKYMFGSYKYNKVIQSIYLTPWQTTTYHTGGLLRRSLLLEPLEKHGLSSQSPAQDHGSTLIQSLLNILTSSHLLQMWGLKHTCWRQGSRRPQSCTVRGTTPAPCMPS